MSANRRTGMARLVYAVLFSLAGLRAAWCNEPAFRQEVLVCVVSLPVAFWMGQNAVERALLIGSCLLVLIAELVNSAIEALVDRVGTERHELSGRAKDQGSAAVLVAIVTAVIVWGLIGWQRFFS